MSKKAKATKSAVEKPDKPVTAKIASKKQWDGASIYAECKALGVYPSFEGGNFLGYFDKASGKKATTALPTLSSVMHDVYIKAETAAVEAAKNAKPKKEKAAKVPKVGGGTRSRLDGAAKIKILAKENPKRAGSTSHKAFEKYKNGMTVAEYIALGESHRASLKWDIDHGFVSIG